MLNSSYARHSQEPDEQVLDTVNILELGDEICRASEVRAFLDAIPEPPAVTEARWKIILAWESGAIGAVEALNALEAHGCLYDADDFMASFVAGTKSRLMLGDEQPPKTPPSPPEASKPVRVTSHAAGMIEALADARIANGRAA